MKPNLLRDLTNKLIRLIEENEEIEKIDVQLLQDNTKQLQPPFYYKIPFYFFELVENRAI